MTARLGDKKDSQQQRHNSENRRANKPLMEKRRRARINESLAMLKTIVVDTNKIEGSHKHAKLEKADILELTVKHLQSLQNLNQNPQPQNINNNNNTNNSNDHTTNGLSGAGAKFQQGFEECTREVAAFLASAAIEKSVAANLIDHLKHHKGEVAPHFGVDSEEISSPFSPLSNSRTVPSSPSPCPSMKSSQDSQDLQLQLQSISMLNSNSNSNSSNSLTSISLPLSSSSVSMPLSMSLPPFVSANGTTLVPGGSHPHPPQIKIQNNTPIINTSMMSPDVNVNVNSRSPVMSSTSSSSGDVAVQVIPTRLPNGQVVFLLPNGATAGSASFVATTGPGQAPSPYPPSTITTSQHILIKQELGDHQHHHHHPANNMNYSDEQPLDFRKSMASNMIHRTNGSSNNNYNSNGYLMSMVDEDCALDLCTKLKNHPMDYEEEGVWRPW